MILIFQKQKQAEFPFSVIVTVATRCEIQFKTKFASFALKKTAWKNVYFCVYLQIQLAQILAAVKFAAVKNFVYLLFSIKHNLLEQLFWHTKWQFKDLVA